MTGLFGQGRVLLGGPFAPTAESAAEVFGYLERDPLITSGIGSGTVHPWYTIFDAFSAQKPGAPA